MIDIPNVKSISWIPVNSYQEPGTGRKSNLSHVSESALTKHIQQDGTPLPFFIQYDHVEVGGIFDDDYATDGLKIQSDFVSVHAYFSLEKLSDNLRP